MKRNSERGMGKKDTLGVGGLDCGDVRRIDEGVVARREV